MVVRPRAWIPGGRYDDDGQCRRACHDYLSFGDAAAENRICGDLGLVLFCGELVEGAVQREPEFDDGRFGETQSNDVAVYSHWGSCRDILPQANPGKDVRRGRADSGCCGGNQTPVLSRVLKNVHLRIGLQNRDSEAIIRTMPGQENKDKLNSARERMLRWDLRGRGIRDPRVLAVMAEVPREEFVPSSYRWQAYNDGPLPIGLDQTISQPYIVALMTEELRVDPDCEVLEIGTGSGYQTAVLSRLVKKVYTVERFSDLTESAQKVLDRLGINNVEFYVGDGSCGWPTSRLPPLGCFDRIMITAALPEIPELVSRQLADGGLIIAPIGGGGAQELVVCEKKANRFMERAICDVRFVKLIGKNAFER